MDEFIMLYTLKVSDMTCIHCQQSVTSAIEQVDPNCEFTIDLATGIVQLTSNQEINNFITAITEAGYATSNAASG